MFLLLSLALVLLVLPGSLQQDECTESQYKDVRLQGGTEYAGRVEVCWKIERNSTIPLYKWLSVCKEEWGIPEARVVCRQLNYTSTATVGLLVCGSECFGQGTAMKVKLECPTAEGSSIEGSSDCTRKSIEISMCDTKTTYAGVICDLPLLSAAVSSTSGQCKPTPSTTTQSSMAPPDTATTQESSGGQNRGAKRPASCSAIGGVLGAVILAMVFLVVGMILGWVWSYRRSSSKKKDQHIENVTPKEAQVTNPTHNMMAYPTERHTASYNGEWIILDHTPGMTGGTNNIIEHSHYPTNRGGERLYHMLEGPTPLENTYHMLEAGGDYATIGEQEKSYEIPLQTTAALSVNMKDDELQHK